MVQFLNVKRIFRNDNVMLNNNMQGFITSCMLGIANHFTFYNSIATNSSLKLWLRFLLRRMKKMMTFCC